MVLSNPPYIPLFRKLPKSVKCFEDGRALFSGSDGMQLITELVRRVELLTKPNDGGVCPRLLFEFDAPNRQRVVDLVASAGHNKVDIRNDQFGLPRLAIVG
jgi:methylase of polypeptide subunit release factors